MREAILAAAGELIAEHGHDFGLPEVARRAGVGTATVYRHFTGVPDIVEQYHSGLIFELTAALRSVSRTGGPRRVFQRYCARWVESAEVWGPAAVRIRPHEGVLTRSDGDHPQSRELYATLAPLLEDLMAAGEVPRQRTDFAVLLWVTVFDERLVLELRHHLGWSRRKVATTLAANLLGALQANGT
jgi:AcrR family transcriptional regulator